MAIKERDDLQTFLTAFGAAGMGETDPRSVRKLEALVFTRHPGASSAAVHRASADIAPPPRRSNLVR